VSPRPLARRKAFSRLIAAFSVTTHVPVALAATCLLRELGAAHATLLGVAWACLTSTLFVVQAVRSMPDHRRSPIVVALVEIPCWIETCAALFSFLPSVLATAGVVAYELARRAPLRLPMTTYLGSYAAGLAIGSYGALVRRRIVRVHRLEVRLARLDPKLDGLCIAHLSDLHIGTFTPKTWGIAWARETMRHAPDCVLVTGDLITSGSDFLDDAAEVVQAIHAPLGVFVSMGNHDHFGDVRALQAKLARGGARVLRNEGTVVEHRGARLWIAGVDDTWTDRADLPRALAGRPDGMTTLLLSHDPGVFDHAACSTVDLVLSGHTHAGQIAVPFAVGALNLSRLGSAYSSGTYRRGGSNMYVSPGLGTTGPPVRIGAAPAITLLVLRSGH
jgi:predicted MPP superfamily phosphohydrolase